MFGWFLLLFGSEEMLVQAKGPLMAFGFWVGFSGVFATLSVGFWIEWITGQRGPRSAPWPVILFFSLAGLVMIAVALSAGRRAILALWRGWQGKMEDGEAERVEEAD